MDKRSWELIIIGAGPAGLTAGIYAARSRIDAMILERFAPGGQIALSDWVENYPGFEDGISGLELVEKMRRQVERLGVPIVNGEVKAIEEHRDKKVVYVDSNWFEAKAVIIATGTAPKKLGVPGEDKLIGKGVSYCATCDAPFYKNMVAAVIGGGDTAVQEALFLSKFASKIYLIHRRDRLRAAPILTEKLFNNEKIEVIWNSIVTEIRGENSVESIVVRNLKTQEESVVRVDGVFIFIGVKPNTVFVSDILDLDANGFIITNENMETNVPGIFAAGDVRRKLLRQVITACADGAIAVYSAESYLEKLK
ncbi:MAG: thioredoxin-disulfide reductase [Thermosulfidibacteraceae bacterium]|jgi:thioredoxin reductase (NADPH)